jgi:cell division protein FtsL
MTTLEITIAIMLMIYILLDYLVVLDVNRKIKKVNLEIMSINDKLDYFKDSVNDIVMSANTNLENHREGLRLLAEQSGVKFNYEPITETKQVGKKMVLQKINKRK